MRGRGRGHRLSFSGAPAPALTAEHARAVLLVLLSTACQCAAKVESGYTRVTRTSAFRYVDKFGFHPSGGWVNGTLSGRWTDFELTTPTTMAVFCEGAWHSALLSTIEEEIAAKIGDEGLERRVQRCEKRLELAHARADILPDAVPLAPVRASGNGDVHKQAHFRLKVAPSASPRVCYVVIAQCPLLNTKRPGIQDSEAEAVYDDVTGNLLDLFMHYRHLASFGIFGMFPLLLRAFVHILYGDNEPPAWIDSVLDMVYGRPKDSSHHWFVLQFENNDGGHLSAEESGLMGMHCLLGLVLLIIVGLFVRAALGRRFRAVRAVTAWIGLVLGVQTLQVWCELVHLAGMQSTGVGSTRLDALSTLAGWLAQLLVASLLVMLAWGWSIGYRSHRFGSGTAEQRVPLTLRDVACGTQPDGKVLPFMGPGVALIVLAIIELVLALFAQVLQYGGGENTSLVHHDFGTSAGLLHAVVRCLVAALFLSGARRRAAAAAADGGHLAAQTQQFTQRLLIAGLGYMFALPACVMLAAVVPAVWRHRVVSVGLITAQTAALIALARAVLGDSLYSKISSLHGSTQAQVDGEVQMHQMHTL